MNRNRRYFPAHFLLMTLISLLFAAATLSLLLLLRRVMPHFHGAVFLLKAAFAIKILNSRFPAESRCSWLFIILTLPFVGIPVYLVFYRPLPSRAERKILDGISERAPIPPCRTAEYPLIKSGDSLSFYKGVGAEYIGSAREMTDMLIRDLKEAKSFIFLEFYTVATGEMWGEIFEVLKEKSLHGVEIRLIYDELGSLGRLPCDFRRRLSSLGISAYCYRERRGLFIAGMNNRNHRKIAVIDGSVAYTGGINVADEYLSPTERMRAWKDSAIRISGNAVNELTYLFLSDLALINGVCEDFSQYYRYADGKSDGYALPFGDGPRALYSEKAARRIVLNMLLYARETVTVTTPYLICDGGIISAIETAVARGVRVRIVIPSRPDRYIAYLLSRGYADRLNRIGAEVYEYAPGFLHAKTYLADSEYAATGSVNLDYRSLWHNFEDGILFYSHPVIKAIEADTERILSESRPLRVKKRSLLPERLSCAIAEIFAPLF